MVEASVFLTQSLKGFLRFSRVFNRASAAKETNLREI
jgi:hypothetical protein